MVKEWLGREEAHVKPQHDLRRFSEMLAVDLYQKRAIRKAEHMPREEINVLARKWNIPSDDWQLTDYQLSTRLLLNRDAVGNYKFAHRIVIPIRFRDESLAILVAETSHDFAFEESRHLMLVDVLKLMGKYLWTYR
jgi:hypothetical protein